MLYGLMNALKTCVDTFASACFIVLLTALGILFAIMLLAAVEILLGHRRIPADPPRYARAARSGSHK